MQIIPDDTVLELTTQLTAFITANALIIIGVIAFAVGVAFVTRWFTKSTRRIKA